MHDWATKQGTAVEVMDLPKAGIKGNTHMLMMDTNSDVVAARVQAWLSKSKLMKSAHAYIRPLDVPADRDPARHHTG